MHRYSMTSWLICLGFLLTVHAVISDHKEAFQCEFSLLMEKYEILLIE